MNVREATREDAATIAALCNAITRELYDTPDVDATAVRQWFDIPNLHTAVVERGGELVGYMDVRNDDGLRFPIDVRVASAARSDGVAELLLATAEDWARQHAVPGAVARGFASERDAALRETLERSGYRLIRHSFTMEIELNDAIAEPVWPDGISVRNYEPRDQRAVYECVEEAFADHWDFHPTTLEQFAHFNLGGERFDPTLVWVAEDGDDFAGVSINSWHWSGDETLGWIGTLGVRRPWRRRGLATALLLHSFRDFRRRGATRVGLGVDAENTTGAVRLYESVGMRPVRRNDQYEKPL